MDNLIYLSNIVLGIVGFLVALNIYNKKREQKPMICPLNMKCDHVLYSRYAKFLGIPMEVLGMIYYCLISVSYTIFFIYPDLKNPLFIFGIFLITISAFIFTIYLVFVQAFKLREWCSWCLMSAAVSSAIFVLTSRTTVVSDILSQSINSFNTLMVVLYAVAVSIGLAITVTIEILFHQYLRDSIITEEESHTLHIMRQLTWLALGTMTVSTYILYMIEPLTLINSSKFALKITLLLATIAINLIYDLLVASRLTEIFADQTVHPDIKMSKLRYLPSILGRIFVLVWVTLLLVEIF